MTEKQRVLAELDAAIDQMDMDAVKVGLNALEALEPPPNPEDPRIFAARILAKEEKTMKISRKTLIAAVAAAAVLFTGVTVYAAASLNLFTLPGGSTYATVRTTDGAMTREEAEALITDEIIQEVPLEAEQPDTENLEFDTLEEAEKALDIPIVLPDNMPDLELASVTGQSIFFGEDYELRTIWVNFGDPYGQSLGVTVSRRLIRPDSEVTTISQSEMDEGSLGSYRSANGTEFTLFTESDETGDLTAHIATVETDSYSYGLVLTGFGEEEQKTLLDALNLSAYR